MPDLEPITREEMLLDGEDLTPVTRKEMFIKRIYDKTQEIPEPVTREEMFLKKAGEGSGGDVTIEQLNVSENGTYSESGKAYSPVVVTVPQPTLTTLTATENRTYTAPSGTAYNEVDVNVPLPANAYLKKSVSGLPQPIASFNDGADAVMQSLTASIVPVQDLHGYDSPWVGGAGKNKLNLTTRASATVQGITSEVKADNTIVASGTSTGNGDITCPVETPFTMANGETYTISLSGTDTRERQFTVFIGTSYRNVGVIPATEHSLTFTVSSELVCNQVMLRSSIGATVNINAKLQIEKGSTATSFAPYENICPISGWSGANVYNDGANLFNQEYPNIDSTTRKLILNVGDGLFRMTTTTPLFTSSGGGTVASNLFLQTGEGEATASTQDDGVWLGHDKVVASTNGKVCIKYRIFNNISAYNPENFETELTKHTTTTIPFTDGQGHSVTVYYGDIDIVNGTLTDISDNNEKIIIDGVNEKVSGVWGATSNGYAVYKSMPVPRPKSVDVMCDKFKYSLQGYSDMPLNSYVGGSGINVNWTFVLPATVTSKEEADAWFAENPTTIVYKKTTPVTYQQQPTSIKSLEGDNNVFASTGDVEELKYFSKEAE